MKNQKNQQQQKYYLKLKLLKTLYWDVEENQWSDEKPWGTGYTPAYEYVKVNSVGKVYQEDDYVEIVGKNWCNTICFNTMQEVMDLVGDWFQIVG